MRITAGPADLECLLLRREYQFPGIFLDLFDPYNLLSLIKELGFSRTGEVARKVLRPAGGERRNERQGSCGYEVSARFK